MDTQNDEHGKDGAFLEYENCLKNKRKSGISEKKYRFTLVLCYTECDFVVVSYRQSQCATLCSTIRPDN